MTTMRQPPEKIYLQFYGDSYESDDEDIHSDGVTWCEDRINDIDITYVREENLLRLKAIEKAARNLVDSVGMTALIDALKS